MNSTEDYIGEKNIDNLTSFANKETLLAKMLASEQQFQMFVMDNFCITPHTCINACAVLLIRFYGVLNGTERCTVAQCCDKTWDTLAQSGIANC